MEAKAGRTIIHLQMDLGRTVTLLYTLQHRIQSPDLGLDGVLLGMSSPMCTKRALHQELVHSVDGKTHSQVDDFVPQHLLVARDNEQRWKPAEI